MSGLNQRAELWNKVCVKEHLGLWSRTGVQSFEPDPRCRLWICAEWQEEDWAGARVSYPHTEDLGWIFHLFRKILGNLSDKKYRLAWKRWASTWNRVYFVGLSAGWSQAFSSFLCCEPALYCSLSHLLHGGGKQRPQTNHILFCQIEI